eukprot:5642914-Prorocentrum_lima.AAC.1
MATLGLSMILAIRYSYSDRTMSQGGRRMLRKLQHRWWHASEKGCARHLSGVPTVQAAFTQ